MATPSKLSCLLLTCRLRCKDEGLARPPSVEGVTRPFCGLSQPQAVLDSLGLFLYSQEMADAPFTELIRLMLSRGVSPRLLGQRFGASASLVLSWCEGKRLPMPETSQLISARILEELDLYPAHAFE